MVTCLAISVLVGLILSAFFFMFLSGRYSYTVSGKHIRLCVNTKNIIFETDEKFLSFAFDASFLGCMMHQLRPEHWRKLRQFAILLSPAYLRLGGRHTNNLTFFRHLNVTPNTYVNCHKEFGPKSRVDLSGEAWTKLNNFAQNTQLKIVMGLNVMMRVNGGQWWNSTNSEDLINFSDMKRLSLDFHLGNEPQNVVSSKKLAKDFDYLKALLKETINLKNSKVIGPDVPITSLSFLRKFLSRTKSVNIVSCHQYNIESRSVTVENLIDLKNYDKFTEQLMYMKQVVHKINKSLPIWLSETSTFREEAVAPGLAGSYVTSFMWLDKLGVAAKYGISVVIRHTFFKGQHALISPLLTPSSDFWISFFYKNLVGRKVLSTEIKNTKSTNLRLYAHCLSPLSPVKGQLVVFGSNLINKTEILLTMGIQLKYPIYSFTFRPEKTNDVTSKKVLLNDKPLEFGFDTIYKTLKNPLTVKLPLVVPSFSINFWVFKENVDAAAKSICS